MNFTLFFHKVIYKLLTKSMKTIRLGNGAPWNLDLRNLCKNSFVISAGAGHDISFELELVERTGCRLVLLDPSPTGRETVRKFRLPESMQFQAAALSNRIGSTSLAKPLNILEGSWRIAEDGLGDEMPSTTLSEIMRCESINKIDLLKIDIEGFEYQVLEEALNRQIPIRQICVEIHEGSEFGKSRLDRWVLILLLYRYGYRIIYSKGWDHTFLHKNSFTG
jgi:FkbM family methyltransferase